jgi:hypothetical protein
MLLKQMEKGQVYGTYKYKPWSSLNGFGPKHLTESRIYKLMRMGYIVGIDPHERYPGANPDDPEYYGFVKVKDPVEKVTVAEWAEVRRAYGSDDIRMLHYWRTDHALLVVVKKINSPLLHFYSVLNDGTKLEAILDHIYA